MHGVSAEGGTAELCERVARCEVEGVESLGESRLDEGAMAIYVAALQKQFKVFSLKAAIAACRERGIWPGGHAPELRDRLVRYDSGAALSADELREYTAEDEAA
eukprot:SAG11_NODE_7577_length_1126_cov_1.454722_3_plen_103_part_01